MLRVAGTIPFLLFKDLSSLYEETPFGADEESAKSKVCTFDFSACSTKSEISRQRNFGMHERLGPPTN